MKRNICKIFLLLLCLSASINLAAQENEGKVFRFMYKDGDNYRILSTVEEDVIINGRHDHHAVIVNRVTVQSNAGENGGGKLKATFMTSEQSNRVDVYGKGLGRTFSWEQSYASEFTRDAQGKYNIPDKYFMPVVRDVPIFPDYPVKPGDTWTSEGHEAHDLRQAFGIEKPFKIPFMATYTYAGTETDKSGKVFDIIKVKYNIAYESPKLKTLDVQAMLTLPATTMGFSSQTLYWDNENGILDHYNEEFRIVLKNYFGDEFIFVGVAHAQTDEFERTNTDENIVAIQEAVEELGLENVKVSRGELGLTISIENIQFMSESSILMQSEKEKLDRMKDIFAAYKNDLLITGYTAMAGTVEGRQELSAQRAQAVAEYIISQGLRSDTAVFTEGKGALNPVATNDTPEGRARNRRVEIIFLD